MRLLVLVAVLGCKGGADKPPNRFGPKQTTTIDVEGFVVPIPDGYRTTSELLDRPFASKVTYHAPSDSHVLVPEGEPDALWISIKSFESDLEATQDRCDQTAKQAAQSVGAVAVVRKVRSTKLGAACAYTMTSAEHDQLLYELPHAGKQLLLVCGSYGVDGHAKRDAACDQFLDAAKGAAPKHTDDRGSAVGSAADPATDARCRRAVGHILKLMAAESKAHLAEPGADEQRVIDGVGQASIATCQGEGLTQAQLDCVLGSTDWAQFRKIGECPAIKAKSPSWLLY